MGRAVLPTEVTGRDDPLPKMMDEGSVGRGDLTEVKLPTLKVVWLEALESMTQSVTTGGTITMVWKEMANSYWSHGLIPGVHAIGGGGARGSVKTGPTCCEGRL
jgi:hypothetical protein